LPLMFAIDDKLLIMGGNRYHTKQMLLHQGENSSCGGVACSGADGSGCSGHSCGGHGCGGECGGH
jgi:hypothetical protein